MRIFECACELPYNNNKVQYQNSGVKYADWSLLCSPLDHSFFLSCATFVSHGTNKANKCFVWFSYLTKSKKTAHTNYTFLSSLFHYFNLLLAFIFFFLSFFLLPWSGLFIFFPIILPCASHPQSHSVECSTLRSASAFFNLLEYIECSLDEPYTTYTPTIARCRCIMCNNQCIFALRSFSLVCIKNRSENENKLAGRQKFRRTLYSAYNH